MAVEAVAAVLDGALAAGVDAQAVAQGVALVAAAETARLMLTADLAFATPPPPTNA